MMNKKKAQHLTAKPYSKTGLLSAPGGSAGADAACARNDSRVMVTKSAGETEDFGRKFAASLKPDEVVIFTGPFGAGKTTFIRGIVKEFTGKNRVCSPSFVILNEYPGPKPVYHFDFYRLKDPADVLSSGFSDYPGTGLVLVEWPEKALPLVPAGYTEVALEYAGQGKRKISIRKKTKTRKI